MATLTIKKLAVEGRLSKGDALESSEDGLCTVAYIVDARTVCVRDMAGNYHKWVVNFGADAHVVGE